ncbi:sorting nexin-5-like isoform X2 [Mizuhopecten yessoensis]|uniref:Sorting nexin-5 n=1 Tax=Mizuhopecten yessoensis TaxID=6573 RepID=A0A210Q999_MIZYE|nr:sorting nexin-5-like isoform X2 [Mizuhopecten yessoensis]OWF45285.1 Sorting nexin-5 [Mizuhopecten yessoensis]
MEEVTESEAAQNNITVNGPFQPLFSVKVPDAVKNGEILQFNIKVFKPDTDELICTVSRQYEDLEWLQHCLMTENNINGIILPPLPAKPETDAKAAEKNTKKQLGSSTNVLMADEFHVHCHSVEKYLVLVLEHEVLGKDKETLNNFLCQQEPPIRAKLKRGIMSRLSSAVEEARKGQHRDIDEYFHKQREWSTEYSKAAKEASQNFNRMLIAQMRLAGCYGHFATTMSAMDVYRDATSVQINMLLSKTAEGMEDSKRGMEVLCVNDEKTLARLLDLYDRYMDSVKEMLFRRTSLLVTYEDATKTLEKAKPAKKAAAEDAMTSSKKAYEECTAVAKKELKSFMQQRIISFEGGLSLFAESQIKTARDTYTLLVRTLKAVKEMDI